MIDERPWAEFEGDAIAGVRDPLAELLIDLLLYKRPFVSPWFVQAGGEDHHARTELEMLRNETLGEAKAAVGVLREWSSMPVPTEGAKDAALAVRRRLIQNLVTVKEGSTEVFLAAAMRAPTESLRSALVHLADLDRAHADRLRGLLGTEPSRREVPPLEGRSVGAAGGRREPANLRTNIEEDMEQLQTLGIHPQRLVLSAAALRHLRDEDGVNMEAGTALGLPTEVEFGWAGECYAILTGERVSLAEIVTKLKSEKGDD